MLSGKDSMGLFWSMVPAVSSRKGTRMRNKVIEKPFEVKIVAVDGYNKVCDAYF